RRPGPSRPPRPETGRSIPRRLPGCSSETITPVDSVDLPRGPARAIASIPQRRWAQGVPLPACDGDLVDPIRGADPAARVTLELGQGLLLARVAVGGACFPRGRRPGGGLAGGFVSGATRASIAPARTSSHTDTGPLRSVSRNP